MPVAQFRADLKVSATTAGTSPGLDGNAAKPFTHEQVVRMVRDGFGDESGAKLIEQRGIDFAPSEDFIQTLKAASAAFLAALRAASPPEPATYQRTADPGSGSPLAGPTGLFFLVRMQSPESNSHLAGPNDLT
jgi:hypothetical protein